MSLSKVIEEYFDKKSGDIFTGLIGKIEKFNVNTMRADVQPLLKLENDLEEIAELPILSDLPVLFWKTSGSVIKPYYIKGDLVWLGFSTYDFENALKEYSRVASKKKFELHNACVLGGIAKENYTASPGLDIYYNGSALILGNINGMHIKIDSSGIYAVTSPGVQFNILTHQHPTAADGPPSSPTPGS